MLHKLGLARDLKVVNNARIAEQMIKDHKRALLEKITQSLVEKREELEEKVSFFTENLITKLSKLNTLTQQYKQTKRKELMHEISALKKSLKEEWRNWKKFSNYVMNLEPHPAFA